MRWDYKENKKKDSPKVDAFLADIHEICKKHGFCIEHEDQHGGFIIEQYDSEKDFEWLGAAAIGMTIHE